MRSWRVREWMVLLAVVGLSVLLPLTASAQTGKIKGTVIDAEKEEPIIGANVVLEGTSRGAATDLDGNFFIIGVQPGKYNVVASAVGYHEMTYEEVVINIDRTTTLEFKLTPSTMALPDVTITYEKPTVELGTTSSVQRITGESLQTSAVEDVTEVLQSMPGFKLDEEGKIHIRGGRNSEARFVVDGIDSRDPITGEVLPINLNAVNIQEIQILTGGMSAEYGQAMSGVVEITTPEGQSDRYNGSVEWSQDHLFDDNGFNQDRANASLGGPLPFSDKVFGRPVTFYLTANANVSDTYTPLGVDYEANDYAGFGFNVPQRQYNDWSTSMKFALELGNGRKASMYYSTRARVWDLFPVGFGDGTYSGSFAWNYKHNLQNRPRAQDRRSSVNLEYTHQISSKTLFKVTVGHQVLNSSATPGQKDPGEFTLSDEVENQQTVAALDLNRNGVWDQDADNDGVVHSEVYDELAADENGNNFVDGWFDSNNNRIYDGGGEGYEDLNMNGQWDPGEDWIDINGNGVYDYAEPWTDRADPVTGANNIGVWDPWDPFQDLNGNGVWDPAEPQLAEQDINSNGRWDGERFQDANNNGVFDRWEPFEDLNGDGVWQQGEPFTDYNGNGVQDDGEGYDDQNANGEMDKLDLVQTQSGVPDDDPEPFWDGDLYFDTGEPFIDLPDPVTGVYNGKWDEGEPFWDLPSSNAGFQLGSVLGLESLGGEQQFMTPTLNGRYDPPNNYFDEYELFTFFSGDKSFPIGYTYDLENHGTEWVYTDYLQYDPNYSTWTNRTLHDTENPVFNVPNGRYDEGQEKFLDYNGNGVWNGSDLFLNPGLWDASAVWAKRRTEEYSFDLSWQSQIHEFHEFKAGFEGKHFIMNNQFISSPDEEYTGEAEVGSNEPWPTRGAVRDFWEYRPWRFAAYVQDKMEFEGLIVQAGVRGDFLVQDQKLVDNMKSRVEAGEPFAEEADNVQYKISPRLGISHPITAESKLYFNYGHFYQAPPFFYYYKSSTTNLDAGTVGNPNLKYQKTVTYELGVHTQVTTDLSFQIAGYYRDMYNMISTRTESEGPITATKYINLDYGRARGLELKIDKKFSKHWQASFNYDFSYAYGKSSGANDEFERRSLNTPVNYDEHPLNWDETHKITCNAALMFAKDDHPFLFGMRLPDYWLMSFNWQFGSGRPYTPSEYTTGIEPELILDNSERLPWTETTTIRFEKYFDIGTVKTIWGISVNNLFDKKNWNSIYTQTGSPVYAVHPLNPDYNPFLNRYEYDANPRMFGSGRQILLKVGLEF